MKTHILFEQGNHRWGIIARDPQRRDQVIDTNEYFVEIDGEVCLLDPGGMEIFPAVFAALSRVVSSDKIRSFFCSHQDPDVFSSLPLWLGVSPTARVYVSWMWTGFIAHFGYEYVDNFAAIPDEGMPLRLGGSREVLHAVPAHYCHASGNFSLYDSEARILFSGDIGAALLPDDHDGLFVEDFSKHASYMEMFHRRWMPSNDAKNKWIGRVRSLDVDMLCPQHGAIYRGDQVGRFLDWFEALQVGVV